MSFKSEFGLLGRAKLPDVSGTRIQLMPVLMQDAQSIPEELAAWRPLFANLCSYFPSTFGIGFLTIDQRHVLAGEYHRRPGLHVDGLGSWGGGGAWGRGGMITVSDVAACRVWRQEFDGDPLGGKDAGDPNEGNCEHLREQLTSIPQLLRANFVYWMSAMCVHESLSMVKDCDRIFVRVSLPSDGLWPANCTPNRLVQLPVERVTVPRRTEGKFAY